MIVTFKRRTWRRRLLFVAIGAFLHLVLDAGFIDTEVFWWPAYGVDFADSELPVFDRPLAVIVALEAIGVACLAWCAHRFGLGDPTRRRRMLHTGRVDRELVAGEPAC